MTMEWVKSLFDSKEDRHKSKQFDWVQLAKFGLFVNPKDFPISTCIKEQKVWEVFETRLVEEIVKPSDTVFDVGANLGYYTMLFSKLAGPKGAVFAFEPGHSNFELLGLNIRKNRVRNVKAFPYAASDKTEDILFYLADGNNGDHRMYDSGDNRKTEKIHAVQIDSLPEIQAIRSIPRGLIKMDIQGGEGRALSGMLKTIGKFKNCLVLSEFAPMYLSHSGVEPIAYFKQLQGLGFQIYNICEENEELEKVEDGDWLLKLYPPSWACQTNIICFQNENDVPAKFRINKTSIFTRFGKGFYSHEGNDALNWRWSEGKSEIRVWNFNPTVQNVQFETVGVSGSPSQLLIKANGIVSQFPIHQGGLPLKMNIALNPGMNLLEVETDAPRMIFPNESRSLHFQFKNARISTGI